MLITKYPPPPVLIVWLIYLSIVLEESHKLLPIVGINGIFLPYTVSWYMISDTKILYPIDSDDGIICNI